MSQPVLLKIYGNLCPVAQPLCRRLEWIAQGCIPMPEYAPVKIADKLLIFSFEGVYYPIDDTLDAIRKNLAQNMIGKLDVLDIENWIITRHIFKNGQVEVNSAPLNSVLAYSGH